MPDAMLPERNVDKLHEVVVPGGQGPPGSVLQGTCRNIFGIYISFQFKILPGKKCPGSPSQVIFVLIATNTQLFPNIRSKQEQSSVSKSNPFQVVARRPVSGTIGEHKQFFHVLVVLDKMVYHQS